MVMPIPPYLVGLGASVWTRSPWWLLAGCAYGLLRVPLELILLDIAKRVGPAIGERLAERIRRRGRRGKRRSGRR